MATKNTESTAVNQLIELVATARPLQPDPSEDLMFRETEKPRRNARMSSPVPNMRGAGEVSPLPRARAPVGTQQGIPVAPRPAPAIRAQPPTVRVTTAPPSRGATIPTLRAAEPATRDSDSDLEVTNPGPIATRSTRPSLPPPRPSKHQTSSFSYPIGVQPTPPARTTAQPSTMPVVAPFDLPIDTGDEAWLTTSKADTKKVEREIGTQQVPRQHDWRAITGKLVVPMIVLVVLGIFIGGYFAFDGDGGRTAPAPSEGAKITMAVEPATEPATAVEPATEPTTAVEPAAIAEPPPAQQASREPSLAVGPASEPAAAVVPPNLAATPAPEVVPPAQPAEVVPTARNPALVDVRIDSRPTGATVMLVDRGKTSFLGTTPMSAALDPSRTYELVFSAEHRATVVEPLDPKQSTRVAVSLGRAATTTRTVARTVAPERAAQVGPVAPIAAPKPAPRKAEPSGLDAAIDKVITEPKPVATGDGTLMISSKPPCEILIDGKPTGLTTPQRAMTLSSGAHKVTLVNASAGIKKTLSVKITPETPTKVIQDFMK